jgi:hypothetical protein
MGSKRKRNRHAGHEADTVAEMAIMMAKYLRGPGFDGFAAWLDQWVIEMKTECPGCGGVHHLPAVDIPVVRGNLERFQKAMENL